MNAVIAKVVPLMMANLKYGTYFFFGSMLFLILCFTVLFVPETRGRSLEDMDPVRIKSKASCCTLGGVSQYGFS